MIKDTVEIEIGGYIEFEHYKNPVLHEGKNFLKLNSGRSCLAHIVLPRKITHIALPFFLCETIRETCEKSGIGISYYHVNPDFTPDTDMDTKSVECMEADANSYLYIVNFHGQLTHSKIQELAKVYNGKIIVDNAQAYFDDPIDDMDTLYTCRKLFGVSDGGILYTSSKDALERYEDLEFDKSADRIGLNPIWQLQLPK